LEELLLKIQKSSPSINLFTNCKVFKIFKNDGLINNVEKEKTKKEKEETFKDTIKLENKVTKKEKKKLSEIIKDIIEIEQLKIHGLDLKSKRKKQRELNFYNPKNDKPILIGEHDEPDTRTFKLINFTIT
jgi:nitric oxide reductase activation protein